MIPISTPTASVLTEPLALPTPAFDNATEQDALFFNAIDQHEQGFHVVVAKTAFRIDAPDPADPSGQARLSAQGEMVPLLTEDEYHEGKIGASVRRESDLAPYKPRCDVIVLADAHAPGGVARAAFAIQLQLWSSTARSAPAALPPLIDKTLHLYGPRHFEYRHQAWHLTAPAPFIQCPLRYEYAVGGAIQVAQGDPAAKQVPQTEQLNDSERAAAQNLDLIAHQASETNPLGLGFCRNWYWKATGFARLAAPQIDDPKQPFDLAAFTRALSGSELPLPAGTGCIGRAWLPRRQLIGHFQDKAVWGEDELPRLPFDFDFAYWNAAPPDQQCPHLCGGERLRLVNLCAFGDPLARPDSQGNQVLQLTLPEASMALLVQDAAGQVAAIKLVIDTVIVDVPGRTLELVWRACWPVDHQACTLRLLHLTEPEQIARLVAIQAEAQPPSVPEATANGST